MATLSTYKTNLSRDKFASLIVTYHSTQIVRVEDDRICLDTGGWKTVTTKRKMNQASADYGLGYSVFQKKGEWFIDWMGETIPFDTNSIALPTKVENFF